MDMENTYDRENFYFFLEDFFYKFKDDNGFKQNIVSKDNIFQLNLIKKEELFTEHYIVEVLNENEKLFTFEMIKYDKYKFAPTVKFGFMFDGDVQERIINEEFNMLIGENEAYPSHESSSDAYGVAVHIGQNKVIDGNTVTNILNKMDFETLVQDIYNADFEHDDEIIETFIKESTGNAVVDDLFNKIDKANKKIM